MDQGTQSLFFTMSYTTKEISHTAPDSGFNSLVEPEDQTADNQFINDEKAKAELLCQSYREPKKSQSMVTSINKRDEQQKLPNKGYWSSSSDSLLESFGYESMKENFDKNLTCENKTNSKYLSDKENTEKNRTIELQNKTNFRYLSDSQNGVSVRLGHARNNDKECFRRQNIRHLFNCWKILKNLRITGKLVDIERYCVVKSEIKKFVELQIKLNDLTKKHIRLAIDIDDVNKDFRIIEKKMDGVYDKLKQRNR